MVQGSGSAGGADRWSSSARCASAAHAALRPEDACEGGRRPDRRGAAHWPLRRSKVLPDPSRSETMRHDTASRPTAKTASLPPRAETCIGGGVGLMLNLHHAMVETARPCTGRKTSPATGSHARSAPQPASLARRLSRSSRDAPWSSLRERPLVSSRHVTSATNRQSQAPLVGLVCVCAPLSLINRRPEMTRA